MKVSRRKFIFISTLSAAVILLNYIMFFKHFEKIVKKIILTDTKDLSIPSSVYEDFFRDAKQQNLFNKYFPSSHQKLIIAHFYYDRFLPFIPFAHSYKLYRSKIIGLFLLSTDYFINKMDLKKEVKYNNLYNPYKNYCSNPFSNLFY